MSLSGEVVSDCQLDGGCRLILKSSPMGLRLHWLTDEGGKQKMLYGTSCLSTVKCGGCLYPVFLDTAIEKALFKNSVPFTKSSGSRNTPSAALVVCGLGTVMAAHCKLPGQCVAVCHMVQSILWTGILEVDNKSVIVVVSKGTTISFGRSGYQEGFHGKESQYAGLLWNTKSLPTVPLTCCGHQNMLLISDGSMCWLSHVSCSEKGKIVLRSSKMCIRGIIRISCEENIKMYSCDGRQYICTWDILSGKNGAEGWKQSVKDNDTELPHTVNDIMKAIGKCSQIVNVEGKAIQTLLLYIKQLSLAQRLLADQKYVFLPSVRVEKGLENKDYFAKLQLRKAEADIDLRGRWWALCLVINVSNGKSVSSIKLTDEQLRSNVYNTMLTLPPFDFSSASGHIEILAYLVLEGFTSSWAMCKVLACKVQVDVLNFVEPECNLSTSSSRLDVGTAAGSNASVTSALRSGLRRYPYPFCEISVSFMYSSKIMELVCKLLNLAVVKDPKAKKSMQTILWYKDNKIDVEYMVENQKVLIKLKGSNPYIVVSSKAALEKIVRELKQSVPVVTLPPSVMREACFTYRLLNFEENHANTVTTITHLYHAITKLSSLIPLR
ncbi:uncharacterized protein LOC123515050 [Portunus trituberculatus]|uniref:uncharacterized protein LOC123515050 n=1 Tax=Portunus trituberculatus TaxID=210409 RepID=UPI001E1CDDBC|nr:uncharacterized protein LOC123515050 [Portunus trituberculatus]XP_045129378.1 uncharacterized protein LOC123515050 [Portunus trituberculatus]XP_045129379.1 uncharacterized protein LOC123515050 [Portunus trituberculatus]